MRSALAAWLNRSRERSAPTIHHRLAAAVLLVETARADFRRDEEELDLVRATLADAFDLNHDEALQLVQDAMARAHDAVSLHDFVATLNRDLEAPEKERLIGWLWQVAYADGRIDPQEEALIRQMADWLYVPHQVFVRQRLQVSPG